MVKTKHPKTKPKKQPHIKRQGKLGDNAQFRAQLDMLGLKIVQVTSDGNCFFRAVADQLEGNEEEHEKYRKMVVQYIMKNRETFEPFIEDDVPFEEYCQNMEKDGTWAGHMELQAASLVTRSNICIHRHMSPRWYIRNFDQSGVCMIHLSYHDGEHYNSVRSKEDPGEGAARPITIKADADLSTTSHKTKDEVSNSKKGPGKYMDDSASIKLVMAGSGCENAAKVEQVLQQVDGDVDAAIELLIAEQVTEENLAENDSHVYQAEIPDGCVENGIPEKQKVLKSGTEESSIATKQKCDDRNSQQDDKKIPRNKVCPCGSKKKYKACCGTAAGKSSIKNLVDEAVDSGKGRKDKKQGKKAGAGRCESGAAPPDLGALCI